MPTSSSAWASTPSRVRPLSSTVASSAPLARLCVRSAYEAGARDVLVNWSDNDVSRSRMELGSEEALSDFKSWQLRRYLTTPRVRAGSACCISSPMTRKSTPVWTARKSAG